MKSLLILALCIILFACNSKKSGNATKRDRDSTSSEFVSDFLNNVKALKSIEGQNPITAFQDSIERIANTVISVKKSNMVSLLMMAKDYNHCVIIVEDHTIVILKDLDDCQPSGSWGTCMPLGEGYIKKGKLLYKSDYINNIIGLPDSQVRKAYLIK
jgi:hypothetical protein